MSETKPTAGALRAVRALRLAGYCNPAWTTTETRMAEIIDRETNLAELLKQLKFMVRDWIEIVGSEEENRTPADRLEKAKAAIAKAEGTDIDLEAHERDLERQGGCGTP